MEATGMDGMVIDAKDVSFRSEEIDGVLVVNACGRIDANNAGEFRAAMDTFLGDETSALVLNLAELSYISSAGLWVILITSRKLQNRKGRLSVCSLSKSIGEVFSISGFDKIISTHPAQADALAAVKG